MSRSSLTHWKSSTWLRPGKFITPLSSSVGKANTTTTRLSSRILSTAKYSPVGEMRARSTSGDLAKSSGVGISAPA